uniref:RWD domain-containing protein n=1 Tax=Biomphalaria glabrata TaxID=6526 RepID=A0A2C9LBI4_BIOGL
IVALESIYNSGENEKIKVLTQAKKDKNQLFNLLITVCPLPIADEIQVEVVLPLDPDVNDMAAAAPFDLSSLKLPANVPLLRSLSGQKFLCSFSVKYLSPLYLLVTFPASYPSKDAPHFDLQCPWLSKTQIACIGQVLEMLWAEGSQMPIIYTWVNWLENNLIRCPDRECSAIVPPYIVQAVLGQEDYMRWEQLLLQKENFNSPDAIHDYTKCKRKNSRQCNGPSGALLQLQQSQDYYSEGSKQYSSLKGRECQTDEELLNNMDQHKNVDGLNPAQFAKYRELRRKLQEEIEAKNLIKNKTQDCPHCRAKVEKIGGADHIWWTSDWSNRSYSFDSRKKLAALLKMTVILNLLLAKPAK